MKNLLHLKGLYGYSQSLSSRSLRPSDEREAEQAHRRVSCGQSRSKCAARVRSANTELLKAETTERRAREEKEPLSSTCLRSASVFASVPPPICGVHADGSFYGHRTSVGN